MFWWCVAYEFARPESGGRGDDDVDEPPKSGVTRSESNGWCGECESERGGDAAARSWVGSSGEMGECSGELIVVASVGGLKWNDALDAAADDDADMCDASR